MARGLSRAAAGAAYLVFFCGSLLMFMTPAESYKSVLLQQFSLGAGASTELQEGDYVFMMQEDCNLVLYKRPGQPQWASDTGGLAQNCYSKLQHDGNAVVYTKQNDAIRHTNTADMNDGSHYIIVQCDGNVVMFNGVGTPIWATDTGKVKLEVFNNSTSSVTESENDVRAVHLSE